MFVKNSKYNLKEHRYYEKQAHRTYIFVGLRSFGNHLSDFHYKINYMILLAYWVAYDCRKSHSIIDKIIWFQEFFDLILI